MIHLVSNAHSWLNTWISVKRSNKVAKVLGASSLFQRDASFSLRCRLISSDNLDKAAIRQFGTSWPFLCTFTSERKSDLTHSIFWRHHVEWKEDYVEDIQRCCDGCHGSKDLQRRPKCTGRYAKGVSAQFAILHGMEEIPIEESVGRTNQGGCWEWDFWRIPWSATKPVVRRWGTSISKVKRVQCAVGHYVSGIVDYFPVISRWCESLHID